MITIHKYPLDIRSKQILSIPKSGVIRHIGMQRATPTLWAQVDSDAPLRNRLIVMHGTGHDIIEPHLPYIGTLLDPDSVYVWHFFDGGEV